MSFEPNFNAGLPFPNLDDPTQAQPGSSDAHLGPWPQLAGGGDPGFQPNMMFALPPAGGSNGNEMIYLPMAALQQFFQPLMHQASASFSEIKQLRNEAADHKRQLDELGSQLKRHSPDTPGDEGDDEGDGSSNANPNRVASKSKHARKSKAQLTDDELHGMQDVFRRVITEGCGVKHFNELKLNGLGDEELELVDDDWDEPWCPDFSKAWSHRRNEVWVRKITDAVMEDEEAKKLVATNKFPAACFDPKFLSRHILSETWTSCRNGAKVNEDFNGAADRRKGHNTKGKRKLRRMRLFRRRRDAVKRDPNDLENGAKFTWGGKDIPPSLLTFEIMSDVVSDREYEVNGIRPHITLGDHREKRQPFEFEGVKPFYRNKIWDPIFSAMETYLNPPKGAKLSARYYAGDNRGDRDIKHSVDEIPAIRYRCHISKYWYSKLPEHRKKTIERSPPGWEVDEEKSVADSTPLDENNN